MSSSNQFRAVCKPYKKDKKIAINPYTKLPLCNYALVNIPPLMIDQKSPPPDYFACKYSYNPPAPTAYLM